jgi:protein-export SecD/SecF family membrane protein
MRLFGDAHYRFIEKRKTAYVVSGAVIAIGVIAMVANIFLVGSWQNYGVDFTGGSLIQVRFQQEQTAGDLRDALGGAQSGAGAFEVVRTESVGPKIGGELQQKAALAILFSFLLTLIYLAIRFEFRFGVAAVIATIHDILITLGFLAVFRVEIALPTVAAILTIVGYSLNDTIVVFDRIRENLGKKGARKQDQVELVNRSINETLPRLLIVGGAVIRDFTLVLILGVLIGTYSSIFVASPALLEIQKRMGKKDGSTRRKRAEPATV